MFFRPNESQILSIPHIQQTDVGECLAACAAMICAYLKIDLSYDDCKSILQIQPGIGAPLSDIRHLDKFKLTTGFKRNSTIEHLYILLESGWPTIVGVQTGELPHWNYISSQHAVVVVGMDNNTVYINDPEMPGAPTPVPLDEFYLAWDAQGQAFAIIAP